MGTITSTRKSDKYYLKDNASAWDSARDLDLDLSPNFPTNLYAVRGYMLLHCLNKTEWDHTETAKLLGCSTWSISTWIKEYDLQAPQVPVQLEEFVAVEEFSELDIGQQEQILVQLAAVIASNNS
jgi:hypothetical protein